MRSFYKRYGLESRKKAEAARLRLHNRLLRAGQTSWRAEAIRDCHDLSLCKVEACPVCLLHFRRGLLDMGKFLELHTGGWSVATVIPDGRLFKFSELYRADLVNIVRAASKAIERSGFADAIVIGGIDVSFNTLDNQEVGWRLEVQILINRPCTEELKRQVRDAFRLAPDARRPVMVKPVQQGTFFRCLSYAYKAMFSLRSSYYDSKRTTAEGAPLKQVRDLPLKAPQAVELAEWLYQYPIGARLILRNIKRTSPPGAPLQAKLLKPVEPWNGGPVGEVLSL